MLVTCILLILHTLHVRTVFRFTIQFIHYSYKNSKLYVVYEGRETGHEPSKQFCEKEIIFSNRQYQETSYPK
jgi:hypothetical protein